MQKPGTLWTHEQFLNAYFTWRALDPLCEARKPAWDHYVDTRDQLQAGTTKLRRISLEARRPYLNPVQ